MPFISVEMVSGRSRDQRSAFAAAVTAAAVEHLQARPGKVSIRFFDLEPSYVSSGGELVDEPDAGAGRA